MWEYEIEAIVMLTKCVEMTRVSRQVSVCRSSSTVPQEKSAQYWPESLSETITPGDRLSVTLSLSTPYAEYHVRKLLVKNVWEWFLHQLHLLWTYSPLIPCLCTILNHHSCVYLLCSWADMIPRCRASYTGGFAFRITGLCTEVPITNYIGGNSDLD